MRVAMLTREYPPEVYGGAGVHVTELTARLRTLSEVTVHCMGAPRADAVVHEPDPALAGANAAVRMLSAQLRMADAAGEVDVVHSHTWYTGLAGHLAATLYGIPHVLTAHSLEPRRPWKAEQLGGGYRISSWSERNAMEHADAVIAVSEGMRHDVLDAYPAIDPDRVHVVHNGIDPTLWHPGAPVPGERPVLEELGVRPDLPIVAFVGRITRQKGVGHLLAAARNFDPDIQVVLCAGAPDTPELAAETAAAVERLRAGRENVFWVQQMLPTEQIRQILAAAAVFVCPSVYEPLGIVNLEAMACATAVVASDVGGIPEVVDDGVTGRLVHYDALAAEEYERGLAEAVNAVAGDPELAARYGEAGRARAIADFDWTRIAARTIEVYEHVRKA
ncbi:glycogen synthase [Nocardia farcinica]|uniref:glycogen synthase n=1 Tax=Nocardia farcinica TaxID=37329 RepID=UPI001894DF11|nr:glycogen synthase [Nocardia farcinica]MBF6270224.1 glycogen synthase [Nocardia farcinica]MBF6293887.1 glycogen synthase [Nocardia farcinica]MBF6374927.1 glycogen synthase [Nocardia farcinica]MBF6380438.1 glycogen synthase [Nocardia farcinica]MCZ9327449.1 glycogen synthase [Nocardia farcinica]